MPRNRFTTHFELDELWVAADMLGQTAQFVRAGFDVTVRLPASNAQFPLGHSSSLAARGSFGYSKSSTPEGDDLVQSVQVIQISLERDTSFGAETAPERPDEVVEFVKQATLLARTIASEFVQWARVRRGQTWLGMSHAEPPMVGIRTLHDETAGQDIRVRVSDGIVLRPMPLDKAVDGALIADLPTLLGDGHPEVPIADALVADANYLMGVRPPNPEQAVLLAAIGLEVAAKSVLRAKIDADRRDLLDYILDNPRDISQQAAALFAATMKVAINRSLQADNKPLFVRIEKLFQRRNAVAHRGARVSIDEAHDLARAAREALVWLSSL